mmetsp:Transcript_11832/g.21348  ORF Transcript_11832/g.21348 Transcript_11832/m.21348 type:complete len:442 (-) Transcript_11832:241-1566(-)
MQQLKMCRLPPLFALLLLLQTLSATLGATITKSYVPLSYAIPFGNEECLFERISEPSEHLTASVFLLAGEELASAIVFEGPIAPPMDMDTKPLGRDLRRYLDRYEKEGVDMFVNGKFGDNMLNVKPVRVAEMVNFEEEEEDYFDDYAMTEKQREEFNRHHDMEHQHPGDDDDEEEKEEGGTGPRGDQPPPGRQRRLPEDEEAEDGDDEWDDDIREREEERRNRLKEEIDAEARMDDDFVKLQMERKADDNAPQRRKIVDNNNSKNNNHGRRLREELRLVAGEPYQSTILIESPGWYRLCVHGKSTAITVEMELRKSSTYGKIDPRTGHVPYLTEVEAHTDIRTLFGKEDDDAILAEEGVLSEEDLRVTKEQIRILERVYGDITQKQLEERRTWNWRTLKNQHLYSHLVLGNLVETIVYMGITGWQVYTIRKWFGGGPTLGR